MKNLVIISDLETLSEIFLCMCYDPQEDKWNRFEVSRRMNQLDGMITYFENHQEHYFVFYNGLKFDTQIIEFIVRNHQRWIDKTSLEICTIISQVAQDTIDDSNYDVFPKYRENQLSFKTIDPFELQGYSNKNRMVSLKRLEFELDLENIEEMPFDHTRINLTNDELAQTVLYCENDVWALYQFYLVTIGETEHPLYKGNDQIELRKNIEEEFGIPCLNYSDSKIGDEMIKKFYCQEKRINYTNLPKKGFFRKSIAVKNCIASYIKFETPELKNFLKKIKGIEFSQKDDFKESLHFYGNIYSFMKGGLHTENKSEIVEATDDTLLIDWDVSSYYPAIIINNERYPAHLGKEFLRGYKHMFDRRLKLKPLAKTDKKIAGIVGALKLAVNSVYGKSSDAQNWIYDRQLTMFTTITGELSLMMLIEQYELQGINIISANTDGITIKIKTSFLDRMFYINNWWCGLTGYTLERTDYQKIVFSTVNDYLAVKTDGEIKQRGDFLTDFELHKNKSARIVPIALKEYFVNGVPVEQTIKGHTNIYDFCIRQKSSKFFHYEGINRKTGEVNVYRKLIRYVVSTTGEKVYKIKNPECPTNAVDRAQVEAGEWTCVICNYLPKTTTPQELNVDYSYYIERAERILRKIKAQGKKQKSVEAIVPSQLNLFG